MTQFPDWLANHAQIIVEALLHSLWISAAIGLFVWFALSRLPARHCNLRYGITLAGLLLTTVGTFAAASGLHYFREHNALRKYETDPASEAHVAVPDVHANHVSHSDHAGLDRKTENTGDSGTMSAPLTSGDNTPPVHAPNVSEGSGPSTTAPFTVKQSDSPKRTVKTDSESDPESGRATAQQGQRASRWLLVIWIAGVLFMFSRTLNALIGMRTLRQELLSDEQSQLAQLESIAIELSKRMRLPQLVRLAMSNQTTTPAVIGFFKPVVLIPPAMLTGVPIDHWEMILAHELAHVRRYDALVNLVQMLIESALFFNPAVWWMSRQVRIEREACCDAVAARTTGRSIEFARVLLNVAAGTWNEESRDPNLKIPKTQAGQQRAFVMALSDKTDLTTLKDRVTRLADPEQRSTPRFTRTGLILALAALIGTTFAIQKGTDIAVKKVAELLTPAERVETLARLQAENTGVFVPGGSSLLQRSEQDVDRSDNPNATEDRFPDPQTDMLDVKVILRTEDGTPVPKELVIRRQYVVRLPGGSTHSTGDNLSGPTEPVEVHEITMKLPRCQFILGGSAPGFAPFTTEARDLFEQSDATTMEITLTRGFDTTVHVTNEQGESISGATITGGPIFKLRGGTTGTNNLQQTTGENGIIPLRHCGPVVYRLIVRAPGYQHNSWEVNLSSDSPTQLMLKTARPSVLRIVDAETKQPVKGAVCVQTLLTQNHAGHPSTIHSSDPRSSDRRYWLTLGESDADGQLVIDQLQDESTYSAAIVADGYGTQGITELQAGQQERTIHLAKPVVVSGKITGELSQLRHNTGSGRKATKSTYLLQYENPLYSSDTNGSLMSTIVSSDGHFTIPDVVPGSLEFRLPDFSTRHRVQVTHSIDDLVVNLPPKEAVQETTQTNLPTRNVILRLTGIREDAPARGYLQVSWFGTEPEMHEPVRSILLDRNQVQLSVPIGAVLRYEPQNLVGYFVSYEGQTATITGGTGPQVIDIPAEPAGAVTGEIRNPDGTPADSGFVTVYPAKVSWFSKWQKNNRRLNPSSASGNSRFFQSLPFGGTYVVFARNHDNGGLLWCLSHPFTIDGENPIENLELQLAPAKPVSVQITAPDGSPLTTDSVELSISLKCEGTDAGNSFSLTAATDENGVARFEHGLPDVKDGPLTVRGFVRIRNTHGFIGKLAALDELSRKDGHYSVQLTPAVSARGILIDAATGRPVPNADIRIYPRDFTKASFADNIRTKTDAIGEFLFDNLEPITYTGQVEGAAIKGSKITLLPAGGYRIQPPATPKNQHLSLTGGETSPVRWEVELVPGRGLSPVPPE
ncbi:MAG: hypothetical protein KDA91_03225 [Planctomycetaceae bacterium]|nr:hypothetical protein [Planctomycetaceae bacterium]